MWLYFNLTSIVSVGYPYDYSSANYSGISKIPYAELFGSSLISIPLQTIIISIIIYGMRYSQRPTYQQQGLLGKGSFAQVHKVRLQGKLYALKRIYNFHLKDPNYYTTIKRQISIMQKLDHPNIVKLIDIYETQNSLEILMELVSGGNLFNKLKSQDRLSQSVVKMYVYDVVKAVKYLHSFSQPILHRDIKPQNILLTEDNRIKLCDFGSANLIVPDHVRDSYVGTTPYMAPQMKQSKPHDQSLDLWCIGILTYQLLTGSIPDVQKPIQYPDYISRPAEDLMKKILVKQQNKRMTIQQIQSHIWFTVPKIEPQISQFTFGASTLSTQKMVQKIKKKNETLRQKLKMKQNLKRNRQHHEVPTLMSSSSLINKAAEEIAAQYVRQFKKIQDLEYKIKQNQKIIEAEKAYNATLKQFSDKNNQVFQQKIKQVQSMNRQLLEKEVNQEQKCIDTVQNLLNRLQKIKQYALQIPQMYKNKILTFNQSKIQANTLPISQYLPKLKLKMLECRRNALIEAKCAMQRRKQMRMIIVEQQKQYGSQIDTNVTTDQILFRDNI